MIKNGIITTAEITAMRRFCEQRAFDMAYYPGISELETNRFNILKQPYFYQAAQALLGPERDNFMENYKFNIEPATDNRPYFFSFFKWSVLPEILALRGQGGLPLLEWGYLILVATFLQALVASLLLILLPLLFLRRQYKGVPRYATRMRVLLYFTAIGLAFLFIEIAFIQQFIRFLHHPLYAVAVVLTAFLVFAGLGSAWSMGWANTRKHHRGVRLAVAGIVLIGITYLILLGPLFAALMAWPMLLKILATIVIIAPLAFCMGMPFPLALASLGDHARTLIPWAWGLNGCASVLSAVLATLLAVHYGFMFVIGLALLLYAGAARIFPGPQAS